MPSKKTLESLRVQISAIESGSATSNGPDSNEGAHGKRFDGHEARNLEHEDRPAKAGAKQDGNAEAPSESKSAFQKILVLLNASDKPEKAIRERLEQSGFTQDAIDEAVSKAKGYGFIDDARYAEVLIRSRLAQGKGSAGIERELAANNIDAYAVEGWPHSFEIDENTELDRAVSLLERKPPRSKNQREAAYRRLVSKGYAPSIASRAARLWCENARM